jgi:hypothetical protein
MSVGVCCVASGADGSASREAIGSIAKEVGRNEAKA